MHRLKLIRRSLWTVVLLLLASASTTSAQSVTTGAIAGVVRDATGAVLPGVTIEASSPALIEKVRTVVSDEQGQYRIIELRPGTYAVTFTVGGFTTVRREGIELTALFTATVNADLRVGSLEETITVSGSSPVVDTRNVTQRRSISSDVIDALPTGKTFQNISVLVPGVTTGLASQDVGGTAGEQWSVLSVHGSRGDQMPAVFDGMPYNNMNNTGGGYNVDIHLNTGAIQEISIATAALSAESKVSGVVTNIIPKEGGNTFRGYFVTSFTNDELQSGNLTPELIGRGLRAANAVDKIWDLNPSLGGRIVRDRLWFFGSFRYWGSEQFIANAYYNLTPTGWAYTPDLSRPPATCCDKWTRSEDLRLTWQASPKHKFTGHSVVQQREKVSGLSATSPFEATTLFRNLPNYLLQSTWTSPLSNKLLLEAGATYYRVTWYSDPQEGVPFGTISARELTTNTVFRSPPTLGQGAHNWQKNIKFAANYVTGSHAFKVGLQQMWGHRRFQNDTYQQLSYTLSGGAPVTLTEWARPIVEEAFLKSALGLFAQDQWTIKRLTLNMGVRFDYHNAYVPEQHLPAVRFVGARDYAPVENVPNWKDVSPRLGGAYDLFGSGKTVLKAGVARYVNSESTATATANNPVNTSVNQASRRWTDANGDFVPDCDLRNPLTNGECGQLSALNFGQVNIVNRYDPEILSGWGVRPYDWEINGGVQHELAPGVGMDVTFTRHWFGNFLALDNLAVPPSGYDPYCVSVPLDRRLPGGGGNQLCGFYDINPTYFGRVDNLVTHTKRLGDQSDVYTGVDINLTARLPRGAMLSGGTSIGREVFDNCGVVDKVDNAANATGNINVGQFASGVGFVSSVGVPVNLQGLASPSSLFCRIEPPFQAQVKVFGVYPLPWWGLQTSATWQSLPGPLILAAYPVTSAAVAGSLGRNLSVGSATVQLIELGTQYEDRLNQLDVRLSKIFQVRRTRITGSLDVYNLFNASAILGLNTQYGPSWLLPTQVLPGRLVKFGAQVTF